MSQGGRLLTVSALTIGSIACGCAEIVGPSRPTAPLGSVGGAIVSEVGATAALEELVLDAGEEGAVVRADLRHRDVAAIPPAVEAEVARRLEGGRIRSFGTVLEPDTMVYYLVDVEAAEGASCRLGVEGTGITIYVECEVDLLELPAEVVARLEASGLGRLSSAAWHDAATDDYFVVEAEAEGQTHRVHITRTGEVLRHQLALKSVVLVPFVGGPLVDEDERRVAVALPEPEPSGDPGAPVETTSELPTESAASEPASPPE